MEAASYDVFDALDKMLSEKKKEKKADEVR